MSQMNKRQLANKYREAAKVIENQPRLHRGSLKAPDGCYCAVGALMHVHGIEPKVNACVSDRPPRDIYAEFVASLKISGEEYCSMAFNDRRADDQFQVARQLRLTARAIEHGGKL